MNKVPMTQRGYDKMREDLQKLKAQRPEAAKAIETARAHGDLSENADYDAAKNRSGMLEAKIRDYESKLALAEVVDTSKLVNPTRIVFGVSAKVLDLESDEEKIFSIVGADESDITKGWISFESPIGKALIGKEEGDIAKVKLPAGTKEYEILEVFLP